MDVLCAICKKTDESLVLVTDRGFDGLLKYSNERKDEETTHYLLEKKNNGVQVKVHEKCRKWYNNKRRLSTKDSEKIECRSLNLANTFEWKINCFLCGYKCESKKFFCKDWRLTATMEIRPTVEMRCEERMRENIEDQWTLEVLGQVKDCSDFVVAEGRYHVSCYAHICSQRDPKKAENTQAGRKPNTDMMENFKRACDWLESEIALHSVKEIQDKMKEQVNGQAAYDVQYIKRLLANRYQDHIYFCNELRQENVV